MELSSGISQFLKQVETLGRSPATITAYQNDLGQLSSFLSEKEVNKVTTADLEAFNRHLAAKGFTLKTLSRKINSIKSFFKYLHAQEKVIVDPSKAVAHPTLQAKLPRVLHADEIELLRTETKANIRLQTLVELMLQTGLRIGEISRLKLEHIRIKNLTGQLLIEEYASSAMRIVELNLAAVKAIKAFIPHRLQVSNDKGYLFNTKNGGGMIIRNIRSTVDRPFRKAGIKNATVNDLRNTFIVYQLNKGVSLEKIGQTVGHKRFSSTEKFLSMMSRSKPGRGAKLAIL